MFIRFLITSIFIIVVQSTVTNNLKNKSSSTLLSPKQFSFDDDDDYLNDKKIHSEGSGSSATLDDYADEDGDDDDDDDQLSKIITSSTVSTTTTVKRIITKTFEQKKKNENYTKINSFDINEFYDDYKDDIDYNEPTIKTTTILLSSTIRPTSIRIILSFLTRPPIAAGILGGLAIGILTSVILLICIVQNYNKDDRTHSSITTGLLYPNQYGYSKTPQEFYA
ncbi:unnamed protein product [Rotaria sordida]|uniref:Syndecan n=1 Tax=Rotaria sordida TaxID=392033 RepID=A0A814P0X3_9BILA|nr:unnamed protein product [Rotaria sordida]CAF0999970.1 unnamed protein product [Rotaria sordida]CAF1093766.1 unnamed protein product [Rotaria sordida]CAF1099692.1 unnamed protein product [Rotaria sordida]CAF1191347.1 unnamed protein product [Rotaria sordida]